jgi:hypothetical protein
MIFCQKNILKHSLSFLYFKKEMHTNICGQSDIVNYYTNISKYILSKGFFTPKSPKHTKQKLSSLLTNGPA